MQEFFILSGSVTSQHLLVLIFFSLFCFQAVVYLVNFDHHAAAAATNRGLYIRLTLLITDNRNLPVSCTI